MNDLEHPEITRCLQTGYPGRMPPTLRCPVCDRELSDSQTVYIFGNKIIGCEECIRTEDASEALCDEYDG